jgi:hypothetical protein
MEPKPYNVDNNCRNEGGANGSCTRPREERDNRRSAAGSPYLETEQCAASQTDQITRPVREPNRHETIMLVLGNPPE